MNNIPGVRLIVLLFLLFGYMKQTKAQTTSSWSTLALKGKFNNRWGAFGEYQLRGLSFYDRFYYYELKGGATYSVTRQFNISLATGLYNTFKGGEEYEGAAGWLGCS